MGSRVLTVGIVTVNVSLIPAQTFRTFTSSIVVVFEVITGAEIHLVQHPIDRLVGLDNLYLYGGTIRVERVIPIHNRRYIGGRGRASSDVDGDDERHLTRLLIDNPEPIVPVWVPRRGRIVLNVAVEIQTLRVPEVCIWHAVGLAAQSGIMKRPIEEE